MPRKLFALFVLIWALGFLVLIYLYFFVYYTATVVMNANVTEYNVELFSKSTAQRWEFECPLEECILSDISPFEYNISIKKEGYKDVTINAKISPRKKQNFVVEMEKQVRLDILEIEQNTETAQQKIQRLRDNAKYFVSFELSEDTKVHFLQDQNQLEMIYKTQDKERTISRFPLVREEDIQVRYIGDAGKELFIQVWNSYYIFSLSAGRLYVLPYTLEVKYIKPGNILWEYLVITEKGAFTYNTATQDSEFQYLFKDFIYSDTTLIWVIYKDEDQKKRNFNIEDKGNLIIRYSPDTKERKILLQTDLQVERIEWRGEDIIFFANGREYKLENL